ncbi:MAG TPA: hypothetical protein VHW02_02365 [Rhizomicrobium sp.]|jgi:hypothetical protein|nr:hypothetical protein [Rhizomicrobium sp.]
MSGIPELPRSRSRHWLEYVTSGTALLLSLISLWVAIETEVANRQMVAASSWPLLEVDSSNIDNEGHSVLLFRVTNTGVGPAKVRSFEVFYKGKPYTSAVSLIRGCCKPDFKRPSLSDKDETTGKFMTAGIPGNVIRAGEIHTFITLGLGSQNENLWRALNSARNYDITYRICYCSVFDECWINSVKGRDQLDPAPVKKCPVPPVAYQE